MSGCAAAEPFALQVLGNSMAPEFCKGCVVIVDPGAPVSHGAFVVAEHGDGVILRQLIIEENQWSLNALATGHPRIRIAGPGVIRGVVTQRAGRRRAKRKN
ncbi:MAG: peptidase [Acidiferrobacteraceae bacterium]|jgi:SOS-response transcriptional repressor LexA|nr:peptidase [Acidiferrobacteraceae bacterium]MDP6551362.1 S24 family peptidase [Arenicellales bacterium]MDP6792174.1 S24 family peptidase [Arenicellales bacterium]MDP6919928.1 S24 family peptidase [Arenicellales bacterium]|tara:strand:+ start:54 stop:356 length:303 start_codon:yes stop_codon:yes gene_type:complete